MNKACLVLVTVITLSSAVAATNSTQPRFNFWWIATTVIAVGGAALAGRQELRGAAIKAAQDITPDRFDDLIPILIDGGLTLIDIIANRAVEATQQTVGSSNGSKVVQEHKLDEAVSQVMIEASNAGQPISVETAIKRVEAAVFRRNQIELEKREAWALNYATARAKTSPDTPLDQLVEEGRQAYGRRVLAQMHKELEG